MFKPNSNQSAEAQSKKGTLSDMKEQQWQKPTGKAQDWVSREPLLVVTYRPHLKDSWVTTPESFIN